MPSTTCYACLMRECAQAQELFSFDCGEHSGCLFSLADAMLDQVASLEAVQPPARLPDVWKRQSCEHSAVSACRRSLRSCVPACQRELKMVPTTQVHNCKGASTTTASAHSRTGTGTSASTVGFLEDVVPLEYCKEQMTNNPQNASVNEAVGFLSKILHLQNSPQNS